MGGWVGGGGVVVVIVVDVAVAVAFVVVAAAAAVCALLVTCVIIIPVEPAKPEGGSFKNINTIGLCLFLFFLLLPVPGFSLFRHSVCLPFFLSFFLSFVAIVLRSFFYLFSIYVSICLPIYLSLFVSI